MSIFIFIAGSRVTPSPTFRLASVEVSAYPSTGPLLRYCSMFMVCLPVYRALAQVLFMVYLPFYRALAQVLYNVCLIVITYSLQGPCSGLRRSTLQALWGNHMLNV